MKTFFYFFTILFIQTNTSAQVAHANAQNNGTYNIEYIEIQKIDTLHLQGMAKAQIDFYKEQARARKGFLKTNGLQSEYNIETRKDIKSTVITANGDNGIITTFSTKAPTMIYYKDLARDSLFLLANNTGENLIVTKTGRDYQWKLLEDTMTIGNLLTHKAINKKGDIAYYTDAYPIFDGPRDFCGLPGLIVKVEVGRMIIQLKKIEKSTTALVVNFPVKFEKVSWEEFVTRINNMGIPGMKNGVKPGKTVSKNGNTTTTTTIEVKKTVF